MGFRLLRNTAALSVVLVLAGCAPHEPEIMPVPEPSATPIFASDEDALAAATDAYAKYVTAADYVFQSGGHDTKPLDDVMTGEFLDSSLQMFKMAAAKGLRSIGTTKFDQVELQQYDRRSNGQAVVVIYVCEDISDVDVVDRSGISVVVAGRPDRTRYEVTFDSPSNTGQLLISQRIAWADSEC